MITLREGWVENRWKHPTVLTDHDVIRQMVEAKHIRFDEFPFDIPPSHVTIVDSPFYGHKISYSEEPDGENFKQILRLSAVKDDVWIAQQVESQRTSNNQPIAGDVLNAGAMLDMVGDAIGAVGSAISKGAEATVECVGDIVSGICE